MGLLWARGCTDVMCLHTLVLLSGWTLPESGREYLLVLAPCQPGENLPVGRITWETRGQRGRLALGRLVGWERATCLRAPASVGFCGARSRGPAQLGLSTIPERSARLYLAPAHTGCVGLHHTRAFLERVVLCCFMWLCSK